MDGLPNLPLTDVGEPLQDLDGDVDWRWWLVLLVTCEMVAPWCFLTPMLRIR